MIYGAVAFFTHVYVSSDGRSFVSDKSKVNSDVSLLSPFTFTSLQPTADTKLFKARPHRHQSRLRDKVPWDNFWDIPMVPVTCNLRKK